MKLKCIPRKSPAPSIEEHGAFAVGKAGNYNLSGRGRAIRRPRYRRAGGSPLPPHPRRAGATAAGYPHGALPTSPPRAGRCLRGVAARLNQRSLSGRTSPVILSTFVMPSIACQAEHVCHAERSRGISRVVVTQSLQRCERDASAALGMTGCVWHNAQTGTRTGARNKKSLSRYRERLFRGPTWNRTKDLLIHFPPVSRSSWTISSPYSPGRT